MRLNDRDGFTDAVLPPGASVLRVYLGNGRRAVELPAEDGRVTAAALVRAALAVRGREMARRALRDARRGRGLRRLAREAVRPRGRRFAAHLAGLPRARAARRARRVRRRPAALAQAGAEGGAPPAAAKAAPSPATGQGDARARWEGFYARESPWGYESAYEQARYAHTLEVLPPGRPRRALELACAEGHFTVHLAPRVDDLLATDISTVALGRAAERCRGLPGTSASRRSTSPATRCPAAST